MLKGYEMVQMATVRAYNAPTELDECLDVLSRETEGAVVLAGGQSVVPLLRSRQLRAQVFLDLGNVAELRGIHVSAERPASLEVGAMTRFRDLVRSPAVAGRWSALSDAAAVVGDRQVRNRGTLGGNLVFGAVASDMTQVVMCLSAQMLLVHRQGERTIPAGDYFAASPETRLRPGELLRMVRFPSRRRGSGSAYAKYGITSNGRPVIGVAASVSLDASGNCSQARMVIGGIVPSPHLVERACRKLVGVNPREDALGAAADAAADEVTPQDDARASSAYRRQLIRVYGRQALQTALVRAQEDLAR